MVYLESKSGGRITHHSEGQDTMKQKAITPNERVAMTRRLTLDVMEMSIRDCRPLPYLLRTLYSIMPQLEKLPRHMRAYLRGWIEAQYVAFIKYNCTLESNGNYIYANTLHYASLDERRELCAVLDVIYKLD